MTLGLALAWPNPGTVLLVAAATGAFLTFVSFRERLPWVQSGAIPLLAFAAVLGFHGIAGNWIVPEGTSASDWLRAKLDSSESGAMLAGFALLLALTAEVLTRRRSRQTTAYALGAVVIGLFGLLIVSTHGVAQPASAAFAHFAVAIGLLASNARWKQRAVAHGGLWVALAGTMWALWWLVPHQPARWGFVVAVEAVLLAAGSVALRGTHGPATALLRRAARDVSFAACVLAVVLSASSLSLRSEWHTGTVFALTLAVFALARLTGLSPLTWVGSVAALIGLVHLGLYTLDGKPETLTLEAAILAHAFLATLAAIACRRQTRVFGDPLRWSARLSSVLAVPLLFFPPVGLSYVSAILAAWLGWRWLTFSLLWRERGAFSAFQGAITLAALLAAFGWIERQPWWATTSLHLRDPRTLHAFGIALGAIAVAWIIARRALRPLARARELWCDDPLSVDRITLVAAVIGFLFLNVVAIVPSVRAELTPLGYPASIVAPPELTHAFDSAAWWLFAVLTIAVLLSWRLSKLERDEDSHAIGLAILLMAVPLVWAGDYSPELAAASALRWGLALAFVAGSGAIALRVSVRRAVEAAGFAMQPSPWLRGWLLGVFAVTAGGVVLLSTDVAEIGLSRLKPSGPAETSVFALMGAMASNLVPLSLVVFGLGLTAGRERSAGYALSGGLVFVATLTAGYALAVITAGKPLDGPAQTILLLMAAASAAVWAIAWLAVEWRVPGGVPLTVQVSIGFGVFTLVCLVPALRLLVMPGEALPVAFDPLGRWGWGVLALVGCAGFWHSRRVWPEGATMVFAFAGITGGVLVAAALRELDAPGDWLSFHGLTLTWVALGFGFFANLHRSELVKWLLTAITALLVICALRGGWADPWKPWLSSSLSLTVAVFLSAIALRTRLAGYSVASGLAITLAAVFVWVAWGPDNVFGLLLALAAGAGYRNRVLGVCPHSARSDRERLAVARSSGASNSLGVRTLGDWVRANIWWHTPHIRLAGVGCARGRGGRVCGGAVGSRSYVLARGVLYVAGVLAVLLGVATVDSRPLWACRPRRWRLAGYALAAVGTAFALSCRTTPLLRMPGRGDSWPWLLGVQSFVTAGVVLLGLHTGLTAPDLLERLANPVSVSMLAVAFAVLTRVCSDTSREAVRITAVALGVFCLAALAWAVPGPAERWVWLHRNAWLFVALTVAAA